MSDSGSQINSPKSPTSNASTSTFKSLKKKIRNKFRLSRAEENKTIAQAVEALKRSDDLMAKSNEDPEILKNEFKELKETLESIINQNQVLSEVVKVVDSACPDPINEPEKFTVYFAQKSLSNQSWGSEEFFFYDDKKEDDGQMPQSAKTHERVNSMTSVDVENAVVRLQNLRMEEQRAFQVERENYETRLGQITFLQQEIEHMRKQNSEHQLQLDVLKSQSSQSANNDSSLQALQEQLESTKETFQTRLSESNSKIQCLSSQIYEKDSEIVSLMNQLNDLKLHLEDSKVRNDEPKEVDQCVISDLKAEYDAKIDEYKQEIELLNGKLSSSENDFESLQFKITQLENDLSDKTSELQEKITQLDSYTNLVDENLSMKLEIESLTKQLSDIEKQPLDTVEVVEKVSDAPKSGNDEIIFKYIYLSNLVLKFMQFPDQRPELSHIIWTTLKSEQDYFQNVMKDSSK